jgi:hypothetical protein
MVSRHYSRSMNELDDVWSEMLERAIAGAESSGRRDVADYLNLKAANDRIRQTGVKWLFDSFLELAGEANRLNTAISMENEHPYSFTFKGANIVGSLLRIRQGVRCLTVEAGWTRTPADGFMRDGALAIARITHFGLAKSNADLILARPGEVPKWFSMPDEYTRRNFRVEDIAAHFRVFLGD